MNATRQGVCTNCQVIWTWKASRTLPGVRRHDAFCKDCGCMLRLVGRKLTEIYPSREGAPLRAGAADDVRRARVVTLAARTPRFSVHYPASMDCLENSAGMLTARAHPG